MAIKKLFLVSIISIAFLSLFVNICYAKIYACLSKTTGEPQGVVSINEKAVADWAKKFILVEADNTYRGKHGYEIKYEGGELRHATKKEIKDYLQAQKQEREARQEQINIEKLLKLLEKEDIKEKIKKIKSPL